MADGEVAGQQHAGLESGRDGAERRTCVANTMQRGNAASVVSVSAKTVRPEVCFRRH